MKNKKKQIEEMVEHIKRVIKSTEPDFNGYRVPKTVELAEELLKYYQPKIDKDSVVMSREEYEELKQDCADIAEHYQEMGRFYDEKCEECDRISNETAEKIIKNILGLIYCLDFETDNKDYDEGFFDAVKTITSRIEHVAKLNSVEIKE